MLLRKMVRAAKNTEEVKTIMSCRNINYEDNNGTNNVMGSGVTFFWFYGAYVMHSLLRTIKNS